MLKCILFSGEKEKNSSMEAPITYGYAMMFDADPAQWKEFLRLGMDGVPHCINPFKAFSLHKLDEVGACYIAHLVRDDAELPACVRVRLIGGILPAGSHQTGFDDPRGMAALGLKESYRIFAKCESSKYIIFFIWYQ